MNSRVSNLAARRRKARAFSWIATAATVFAGILLFVLLGKIVHDGAGALSFAFLNMWPSSIAANSGIKPALYGTLWVVAVTAVIAIPTGVAAAVFLEEFTIRKNRFTEFIQIVISNLAGVPSIVYGLLGLALFVRWMELGRSVLAGSLTMSLLILPLIIIVSQEALKAVQPSYRDASFALGATHWQTIRRVVLPIALPGILTGVILAISRAIGETAPLLVVGAATFIRFVPSNVHDQFTVLPIQIFNWTSKPEPLGFTEVAAAGIIVLMVMLLTLNSIAIWIRSKTQRQI